ncbi:MAG: hypothetical protein ACR2NW_03095 [Thermodesulfobacteriota bacterium]
MRKYQLTVIILITTALTFVGLINIVEAQNSEKPTKITVTGSNDAPSKTYAAYANAVWEGNIEEFKKYVPSENLKLMPEDENEVVLGLDFVQDTMMTNMEIIKSTISGNNAELKIKGSRGIDKADGTVKMVLENGSWKVSEESWKLK